MRTERRARPGGARERTRLPFRLHFGAVELDLHPNGGVCVVWPVRVDYHDLATFLTAMRAKGGA